MTNTIIQRRTVPASAMRFAIGELASIGTPSVKDGPVPIKLTARTGRLVVHPAWGNVVHDLSGAQFPRPRIPLDYQHDPMHVIGFAENFDVSSGNLLADGAIVPYVDGDLPNQILTNAKTGVPYQCSIFFDPATAKIERLNQGQSAQVNGQSINGPATIFRQWSLRGIALTPYGLDGNTHVQFAGLVGEVQVNVFSASPGGTPAAASASTAPANDLPPRLMSDRDYELLQLAANKARRNLEELERKVDQDVKLRWRAAHGDPVAKLALQIRFGEAKRLRY